MVEKRMTFEEIMAEELGEAVQIEEAIDDTSVDSLTFLQFVQELEKRFKIAIPDERLAKAETFRQLKAIVDDLAVKVQ